MGIISRRVLFSTNGAEMLVVNPPHMDGEDLVEEVDLEINYFCRLYSCELMQVLTAEDAERYKAPRHVGIFRSAATTIEDAENSPRDDPAAAFGCTRCE